jgi:SAM-dependent methyltransferase
MSSNSINRNNRRYWDSTSHDYHDETTISIKDFHYGPLVPGDLTLKLLPESLEGLKCYEFGCGAAQNSFFLSSHGAECYASDISEKQIAAAHVIAESTGLKVKLSCQGMDEPFPVVYGGFDLIHSAYAISFSPYPHRVVAQAAAALKPGGILLFSTGHPLFAGEWLELEGENGVFLRDYFKLPPDIRYDDDGKEAIRSVFYNFEKLSKWTSRAGLMIERILEPRPVELRNHSARQLMDKVPYYSSAWWEHYDRLAHCPVVTILKCRKPA